jgi:hypothetical protein
MKPLDLSTRPPRSGLEKLGGFYLLARTIDKIRAHLPGRNPGEYKIPGFSERLLQARPNVRSKPFSTVTW